MTIRSFLSHSDVPGHAAILDGTELHAFGEKISAETGEPLESGATVVKFIRSDRRVAAFVSVAGILGLGLICLYLWRTEMDQYAHHPHLIVVPGILLSAVSGIAFFLVLQTGFSDLWLVVERDGFRFRVRRVIRYHVERFPFASIEEIAIEFFPASPRHGELARLTVARNEQPPAELFRGQVVDAENGGIAFAAGLLGAATGLPVTRRRHPRFWEKP